MNTRAVGTVYEDGEPKNGVRVRLSYKSGGPPVLPDFITGHDPINPTQLDPDHPGYYQFGMLEGGNREGYWCVFLLDDKRKVASETRCFMTAGERTTDSCNVATTDFSLQ